MGKGKRKRLQKEISPAVNKQTTKNELAKTRITEIFSKHKIHILVFVLVLLSLIAALMLPPVLAICLQLAYILVIGFILFLQYRKGVLKNSIEGDDKCLQDIENIQ